jgi:hypothetical protein
LDSNESGCPSRSDLALFPTFAETISNGCASRHQQVQHYDIPEFIFSGKEKLSFSPSPLCRFAKKSPDLCIGANGLSVFGNV